MIHVGDSLAVLRTLPSEIVQCCVTSPPYFGLRDYGVAEQIGQERTPAEYVARLVEVFREARRVLRDDGTLWLNLGDSYANGKCGRDDEDEESLRRRFAAYGTGRPKVGRKGANGRARRAPEGLKPKDLIGIPWMVAFALRDDGWTLRQEIIWHKRAPMPESVRDRPTRAHEQVFLLSKSATYFYDAEAIAEEASPNKPWSKRSSGGAKAAIARADGGNVKTLGRPAAARRNARSVWTLGPEPFPEPHFAVFPTEIPRRAILAGSRVGDTVLDPFCGAGTTGLVADAHQRRFIGIELNPAYAEMARRRIERDGAPLFRAEGT